jgi:hypothetical protein
MIKRILSDFWKLPLMIILAGLYAFGGELTVSIRQPFKAVGRDFPAGHYRVLADDKNDQYVNFRNLDTQEDMAIQVTTRLSPREGENGSVVFDKVGNDYYLAEIYIVGMDGFFFRGAPGKHKHLVVKEEVEK